MGTVVIWPEKSREQIEVELLSHLQHCQEAWLLADGEHDRMVRRVQLIKALENYVAVVLGHSNPGYEPGLEWHQQYIH